MIDNIIIIIIIVDISITCMAVSSTLKFASRSSFNNISKNDDV